MSHPSPDNQAGATDKAAEVPTQPPTLGEETSTRDFVPAPMPVDMVLPTRFGRYEVRKLLGKGGMGAVYLAHDPQLDRLVALKIPRFARGESDQATARFLREARSAATLHHPGICPVFDVGQIDGVLYLTMAFIEGQPLSSLVEGGRPLPPEQAVRIVRELALAIQEAHEHGITHRDLKPANVMLNKKSQPVIMDFGLALRSTAHEERLTHSGTVMGTPAYMSPEQVNGEVAQMGPPTDVYALGVILYELLTGKLPFVGALGSLMADILRTPPPPLARHIEGLDPRLQEVIDRALAKKPGDRFASAGDLALALAAILGEAGSPPQVLATVLLPTEEPLAAELADPERPRGLRPTRPLRPEPRRKATPAPRRGSRFLLLGCGGCLLAVLVAASGLVYLADKGIRGIWDQLSREMDRARDFEAAARLWKSPPEGAGPEVLFPKQLGKYSLVRHDQNADLWAFDIRERGRHATYRGSEGAIELYVYRKNDQECHDLATKVFEKVQPKAKNADAGGLRTLRGEPGSPPLVYSHQPPLGKYSSGILWWKNGWLLHASTDSSGVQPEEFLTQYLLTQVAPAAPPLK